MKPWIKIIALVVAVSCLPLATYGQDDDREDYEAGGVPSYALGFGLGLVDPEGPTEPYYSVALRIRMGRHDRDREDLQAEGMQGFIEPEIGYWERDAGNSDMLAGVNLIGVVPFRRVDYSFGVGAGIHFLDFQVQQGLDVIDDSDERFGVNAQFGIDLHMTDNLTAFGTGRFDLVEGNEFELQNKVYLGLRALF